MSNARKCPLLKKPCIESGCTFWTHLLGTNPNTGMPVDEFGCSIAWLPVLLIENARHTRGAQAAVESMRNEVIGRQDTLNGLIAQASRRPNQIKDVPQTDEPLITGEKNGR